MLRLYSKIGGLLNGCDKLTLVFFLCLFPSASCYLSYPCRSNGANGKQESELSYLYTMLLLVLLRFACSGPESLLIIDTFNGWFEQYNEEEENLEFFFASRSWCSCSSLSAPCARCTRWRYHKAEDWQTLSRLRRDLGSCGKSNYAQHAETKSTASCTLF